MKGIEYVLMVKEISNKEIAETLGVSAQLFHHWVKGTRRRPDELGEELKDRFGVEESYFFKEVDSKDRIEMELMMEKREGKEGSMERLVNENESLKRNHKMLLDEYVELEQKHKEDKKKIIQFIEGLD